MSDDHDDFGSVDWSQLEGEAEEALGATPNLISPAMLAKRILWDVTPCEHAVEVAKYIGMPPASKDVEDMEHDESHQRLVGARLAAPFVNDMSKYAARAIMGSMILGHGHQDEVSAEEHNDAAEKLQPVIFQASIAIIAELLDAGVLHYPHGMIIFQEQQ